VRRELKILRYIGLIFVSIVPFSQLRLLLYRKMFGFEISPKVKIGMFNFLDIQNVFLGTQSAITGFGNIFISMVTLYLDDHARIGGPRFGLNLFRGIANKSGYEPNKFMLGRCSIIELLNYFDLSADIKIGSNTVIGGIRNTFHINGFQPIFIKDNVYVGSNCCFQMGAVVVKPIDEGDCLVAGVPAKVIVSRYGHNAENAYAPRKKVFYKNEEYVFPVSK